MRISTRHATNRWGQGVGAIREVSGPSIVELPLHVSLHFNHQPSVLLRVALTARGTTALFVIVTGFALWRHRREQAVLGLAGPA